MKFLVLALGLIAGCNALAATNDYDSRPVRNQVAKSLEAGQTGQLAIDAFDSMFQEAQRQLRKKGQAQMAYELGKEWQDFGEDLLRVAAFTDTGDHAPYSEWVQSWYAKLEAALGIPLMELTHLRDIWVLNYTLPVVFNPQSDSQWCLEWKEQRSSDNCMNEYRRHLAGTKWQRHPDPEADKILHHGFAGVVTYWSVTAACFAAGPTVPVCGLAGTGAEFVMERYFAPGISDRLYTRVNASHAACPCDCGCEEGEPCDCDDCECDRCPGDDEEDEA